MKHAVKLEYPHGDFPLILKHSYTEPAFFGVDHFERKKIKLILSKYGCRHSFHSLPGKVTANLNPFIWDRLGQCFRIELNRKVSIQLNTLEVEVVNDPVFDDG